MFVESYLSPVPHLLPCLLCILTWCDYNISSSLSVMCNVASMYLWQWPELPPPPASALHNTVLSQSDSHTITITKGGFPGLKHTTNHSWTKAYIKKQRILSWIKGARIFLLELNVEKIFVHNLGLSPWLWVPPVFFSDYLRVTQDYLRIFLKYLFVLCWGIFPLEYFGIRGKSDHLDWPHWLKFNSSG